MLPTPTDNGARLAAILPTGVAALARGLGKDPSEALSTALGSAIEAPTSLPPIRSFVMVVVDGLGYANLQARAGHARTLASLQGRRIETVVPSTTGAALTTLVTARLPGEHGLIGYKIRHPELGLLSTLKDWSGIVDPGNWQRSAPLFELARSLGARPIALGRPAHATGGLTEAILRGADYVAGQRIEDRFAACSALLREGQPLLAYLYVDELDKAAHEFGWESAQWTRRLEQLDAALEGFLRGLPGDVGVVITADHGIVDVPESGRLMLDLDSPLLSGVAEIGGEPRMRSLYLDSPTDAPEIAARIAATEQKNAWVDTRDEAIAAGWFGRVAESVAPRLGDVIIAARRRVAYVLSTDDPGVHRMVGQHGSLSEEERGVPLLLAGVLAGSGFAAAVTKLASGVPH